jgi:anti-sigma28 factor (negative regulator of flagellin synthesis)
MTKQHPNPHAKSTKTKPEGRRKTKQWQYILGYNDGVAVGLKEGERNGYEDGVKDREERTEKRILAEIAKGTYRLPGDVLRVQLALQVCANTIKARPALSRRG